MSLSTEKTEAQVLEHATCEGIVQTNFYTSSSFDRLCAYVVGAVVVAVCVYEHSQPSEEVLITKYVSCKQYQT